MAKAKKKTKAKPRRYSDEERANALAALAANGGNVSRTARQLGVPAKTLANWGRGDRHPESAQMGEQKKGALADRLEEVAWKMADAIPEKLAKTPLNQLAVSLGIVIDKMRLLRNEPTEISRTEGQPDDPRTLTDDELARELALARSRAAGAGAGPGAGAAPGGGAGPPAGPEGA